MHETAPGSHRPLRGDAAMSIFALAFSVWPLDGVAIASADAPLRISIYATAGDVLRHLPTDQDRERVCRIIEPLRVSRLFLEGRRGDEYAPPALLKETRQFFVSRGIECSGGIATVPGSSFGIRQKGGLDWLNWESEKTRRDISRFFTENAPIFDELIVDDFFCTSDTSPESQRARLDRSWSEYRRDLMVSLIDPIMRQPTRAANSRTRLIVKFPQWYDRFHMFGYDPPAMAQMFDQVWVGTEVRDPSTRRMGFVQPTEGYINFRWLASIAGEKAIGAWFDHIECSPRHFVDQAFQSVLAGARELTLFRLGDVMDQHPGDALLASRLAGLFDLAAKVRGRAREGIPFYKPPGSDADDNIYLMDYLAMIGLPILPEATYPYRSRVAFLGVQAASDPDLVRKARRHLEEGATLIFTPGLVRSVGLPAAELAGVQLGKGGAPATTTQIKIGDRPVSLPAPLELDPALKNSKARNRIEAQVADGVVSLLTWRSRGRGAVCVANLWSFSERDFRDAREWLLAPKPRGLPRVPEALANELRQLFLAPLGVRLEAPPGVGLCLFAQAACLYNFNDEAAQVRLNDKPLELAPSGWLWIDKR